MNMLNEKSKFIINLKFNIYGYALSQQHLYVGFEFVETSSMFTSDAIMNYDKQTNLGYTLMVDVYYIVYTYNN